MPSPNKLMQSTSSDIAAPGNRASHTDALIHRDYDIAGAKCQLAVTEHTITIKSPGQRPPPITLEQLQTFNAPMLSRNPELHYIFARMELAEEQGLGIKSLKAGAVKLGLPLPRYTFEAPYLVLTLYRSREGATLTLSPKILGSLNKDEKSGWEFLVSKESATMAEYADHMEFDKRKAQRHLSRFVELGLLRRVGVGRATRYEVVRP